MIGERTRVALSFSHIAFAPNPRQLARWHSDGLSSPSLAQAPLKLLLPFTAESIAASVVQPRSACSRLGPANHALSHGARHRCRSPKFAALRAIKGMQRAAAQRCLSFAANLRSVVAAQLQRHCSPPYVNVTLERIGRRCRARIAVTSRRKQSTKRERCPSGPSSRARCQGYGRECGSSPAS